MAKEVKMGIELDLNVNASEVKKEVAKIDKEIAKPRELEVKVDVDSKDLEIAKKLADEFGMRDYLVNLGVDLSEIKQASKEIDNVEKKIKKVKKLSPKMQAKQDKLVESLATGKDNGFTAAQLEKGLNNSIIMGKVQSLREEILNKNKILESITQGFADEVKGSEEKAGIELGSIQKASTDLTGAFKKLKSGDFVGFISSIKSGSSEAIASLNSLKRAASGININSSKSIDLGSKKMGSSPDIDLDVDAGALTKGLGAVTGSAGVATKAVSGFGQATASASSGAASAGAASASMAGGMSAVAGTAGSASSGVAALGAATVASGGTILIVIAAVAAALATIIAIVAVLVAKFKMMMMSLRLTRDVLTALGRAGLGIVSTFYNFGDSVDYVLQKLSSMNGIAGWVGQALTDLKGKIENAFSVDSIKAFSDECTELFSDLVELQNVIDNVFPSMSDEINKFAKTSQALYGLTELQAKQGASKFGGLLQSANVGEEVKVKASLDLTTLSADLASFYNLEYEEAMSKLSSGLVGEIEPLRQVGINMTVAEVESWAQSVGKLAGSWANLTSTEQYMLRYEYLMSNLSVAMGDFSRTQFSWANQFKLMGAGLENIKTKLGYILMQIMYPMLVVANQIVTLISSLLGGFVSSLGFDDFMMGGGAGALAPAVDTSGVDSLGDSYDNAADKAEKAKKASQDLAGVFKLNNLSEDNSDSGSGSGGAGGGIGGGAGGVDLGGLNKQPDMKLPKWLKKVINYFEELRDLIEDGEWGLVGEKLGDGLNEVFKWLVIDEDAIKKVLSYVDTLTQVLNGFIKTIDFSYLGEAIASGVNLIVYALYDFATKVNWGALGAKISEGLNTMIEDIDWYALGKTIMESFNATFKMLYLAAATFNWAGLGKSIAKSINGMFSNYSGLINAAKFAATVVNGLFTSLSDLIKTTNWKQVGTALGTTLYTYFSTIDFSLVFGTMADLVIGLIDAVSAFLLSGDWTEITDNFKKGIEDAIDKIDSEDAKTKVKDIIKALFAEDGLVSSIWDAINIINWQAVFNLVIDYVTGMLATAWNSWNATNGNWFTRLFTFDVSTDFNMEDFDINDFLTEDYKQDSESTVDSEYNVNSFGVLNSSAEDTGGTTFKPLTGADLIDIDSITTSIDETTSAWDTMYSDFIAESEAETPKVTTQYEGMCSSVDRFTSGVTSSCTTAWNNFWLGTVTETNEGTGEVETRTGGFSSKLSSTWEKMTGYLSSVWGSLWSGENSIKSKVVSGAQQAYGAVTGWFGSLKTEFNTKKEELFKKWSDLWTDIKEYPGKKAEEIKQAVADAFEVAKGAITDWITAREKEWSDFWLGLPGKIGNIGTTIKNKVNDVLSTNIFSGLGKTLAGELDSANPKAKSIDTTMNYSMGSQPSMSIPKLARGGVIKPNSEFMAILGDQKSGVNVETPLSTMIDAFNTALMGSGFGEEGDTNIEVYINDERQDNSSVKVRKQTFRSNGRN